MQVRAFFIFLAPIVFVSSLAGQPRVDNVLVRMVPPRSTSLLDAHMDQIKRTEIYRKLVAAQSLVPLDEFAAETGFDPRRDVREFLFVTGEAGAVMLARGTFHLNPASLKSMTQSMTKIRHGQYDIWSRGRSGFCVLDSTLAVAGDVGAIAAVLNEWTSGTHAAAQPLLARVAGLNPQSPLWGISIGKGSFLAGRPLIAGPGLDFSKILRSLQEAWFEADFSTGLRADLHGTTATEKDAINLRDTVRGLVGLGRLNVPENQPDLLRAWDGIGVEMSGRSITVRVDIPQDLIDKMVQMLNEGISAQRRIL